MLFLGKSEMLLTHRDLFTPRRPQAPHLPQGGRAPTTAGRVASAVDGDRAASDRWPRTTRLRRDAAFELGAARPADRLARPGGSTFANLRGPRAVRDLASRESGGRSRTSRSSYRPVELRRTSSRRCASAAASRSARSAFAPASGDERRLDVPVTPLLLRRHVALGVSVAFEDVTRYAALQRELEGNRRDLESAYEELQSTIEELETTNEELQSTNEELETTNEELQSTNEELETMNEELQSTNEELETINDELRERTAELNEVNDFLEAILTSLGLGVAVLDRDSASQVWNRRAEDLWGLRQDEAVEQHFLGLDIGLPTERLAPALRAVLSGASERETPSSRPSTAAGGAIVCRHRAAARQPARGDGTPIARRDRADGGPPPRRAVTRILMDDDRDHEAAARSARGTRARRRARTRPSGGPARCAGNPRGRRRPQRVAAPPPRAGGAYARDRRSGAHARRRPAGESTRAMSTSTRSVTPGL